MFHCIYKMSKEEKVLILKWVTQSLQSFDSIKSKIELKKYTVKIRKIWN